MSPPGRPKGESLSAQREVRPLSPPGRAKGESLSAQREVRPLGPPGRPKGESLSAQREDGPLRPPGRPKGESLSAQREGGPTSTWVLLRGLTREAGHWGDFPAQLSDALGQTVVTLDVPGNGARCAERSATRIRPMAADLDAQVRRLAPVGPVSVLAMSLGAMVAVEWARIASVALERLVLISTSLRPFAPSHWRMRPRAATILLWHLLRGSPHALEDAVLAYTSARADRSVLAHWLALRAAHPVSRANALRQLLAAARFRCAAAPRVPTLLLAGRGDRLVDPRCTERIAAAWRCRVALHPTAGHDVPLDEASWVIAQVRAWVEASAQ